MAIINQSDDIDAINVYIEGRASKIPDFPKLGPVVTAWRGWYHDLSWYRKNFAESALNEAIAYREKTDAAMNISPVPWTPADKRDISTTTLFTTPMILGMVAIPALIVFGYSMRKT